MSKFNAAFWKWFGASKVVDAEGKPLVVYHGTPRDFSSFQLSSIGRFGPGIYLTDDPKSASEYAVAHTASAKRGGHSVAASVMPLYVRVQRPFIEGEMGDFWTRFGGTTDAEVVKTMLRNGYDGIIIRNSDGSSDVIVFDPTQIKSATGNDGTWDADDPDIRSNPATEISELRAGVRRAKAAGDHAAARGLQEEIEKIEDHFGLS